MVYKIKLKVNGWEQTHEVEPRLLLVHFIRRVRYNVVHSKVPVHLNPFL